jgi:4-hydroxy-tetrahydrodipicolinate reductase
VKNTTIRVLHVGLGPVGAAIARQVSTRPGFRSVAAVDVDPRKAGRDLGDVIGSSERLRVRVETEVARAVRAGKPDVAVLCTGSSLKRVLPELTALLRSRIPVVSTTEELAYPGYAHMRLAREVHALATARRVAVLGTGVNPGFAMDTLPIVLTAACERVDRIAVTRVQDASTRRLPFQQKIGAGLTPQAFSARVADGTVRHVGFTESIAMIADAVGWKLDRITDEVEPKMANAPVSSAFIAVREGQVCGLVQRGVGYRRGHALVTLHMEAYLGAPESFDAVTVEGVPGLSMRIEGGIPGDVVTASVVVNSIPKVLNAPPGLHTMRDLPLPSFGGRRS